YDFDESELQLTQLGSSDPAKLVAALVQAEADLVDKMGKAAASADLLDGLAAARDGTKARLDFEGNARQRWLWSALRGDGDQPPSWPAAVPGGDARAAPAAAPAKPLPPAGGKASGSPKAAKPAASPAPTEGPAKS